MGRAFGAHHYPPEEVEVPPRDLTIGKGFRRPEPGLSWPARITSETSIESMSDADLSPLALALGRVPTGLYVVSSEVDGSPIGFVGSFVMQAGFDPPTLSVAIGHGRAHLDAIRSSGRFAVSILDTESSKVMARLLQAV